MKYKVEKYVDGEWYLWGTYNTTKEACYACFELGKADVEDARVTEVWPNNTPTSWERLKEFNDFCE